MLDKIAMCIGYGFMGSVIIMAATYIIAELALKWMRSAGILYDFVRFTAYKPQKTETERSGG